jgi:hypothetical protein
VSSLNSQITIEWIQQIFKRRNAMWLNLRKGQCAIAAFSLPLSLWAQGSYPSKPVTLIVPFPAGMGEQVNCNIALRTLAKSPAGEIAYLDGAELETFWKADLARTSATTQRMGRVQ